MCNCLIWLAPLALMYSNNKVLTVSFDILFTSPDTSGQVSIVLPDRGNENGMSLFCAEDVTEALRPNWEHLRNIMLFH